MLENCTTDVTETSAETLLSGAFLSVTAWTIAVVVAPGEGRMESRACYKKLLI